MSWTRPVRQIAQFYYCGWLCTLLEEDGTGRRFVSYPPELCWIGVKLPPPIPENLR